MDVSAVTTAIFTGALFFATLALWWATRQLVVGAERTAKQQLRAYITVAEASFTIENDTTLKITVTLNNNGQTPAKKYRGWVTGSVHPKLPDDANLGEPIYEGQGFAPLGAGGRAFLYTTIPIAPSEVAQLAQKLKYVYLVGFVEYVDIFDQSQELKFSMMSDPEARPMLRPWGDRSGMT